MAVAAVGWSLLLAMVVVRWPDGVRRWLAIVGVAAVVAVVGLAFGRRLVHDRERREQVRDVLLVVSLTVAAAATVYAATVLVIGGAAAARRCRHGAVAALGAVVVGDDDRAGVALAAPLDSERPPDAGLTAAELLEQFGRRLAGMVPIDDTIEQLAESLRPACAAAAAEVWRWDGAACGWPRRHLGVPRRRSRSTPNRRR